MTNYDGREATGNKSCIARRDEKIGRKIDGRKKEREKRRRREELDFAYPLVTSFHQRLIQKRGAIETMSMLDQHRLTACLISRFHWSPIRSGRSVNSLVIYNSAAGRCRDRFVSVKTVPKYERPTGVNDDKWEVIKVEQLSSNFERRKIKVDVNFIIENVFKNLLEWLYSFFLILTLSLS